MPFLMYSQSQQSWCSRTQTSVTAKALNIPSIIHNVNINPNSSEKTTLISCLSYWSLISGITWLCTRTAELCVENSTIALPFFLFDTSSAVTSPYCWQQAAMNVTHMYCILYIIILYSSILTIIHTICTFTKQARMYCGSGTGTCWRLHSPDDSTFFQEMTSRPASWTYDVNWLFTWRTVLPNFTPIQLEMMEP